MRPLTIYTDGSCEPNPGPGGWAYVILWPNGKPEESGGSHPQTTNNRMELIAAIMALRRVPPGSSCQLCTDSEYLRKGITSWINKWRRRDWKKGKHRDSKPILNAGLWQRLDALNRDREVTWIRVPGHVGDYWNERCDRRSGEYRLAQAESPPEADPHDFGQISLDFHPPAVLSLGCVVERLEGEAEATM